MANLNDDTHYELCPTPTTATTAQPLNFKINYGVIFQTFTARIINHFGEPLGLRLVPAFCLNALQNLPAALVAAIPVVFRFDLQILAGMGARHVPVAEKRDAFHLFFRPSCVRLKPNQLPAEVKYHIMTDGVGLSWSVERPWPDPQHQRPKLSFVDDANRRANVDMLGLQRGCVRLDRGVLNLGARVAMDPNPVISIDPGIVNVVSAVDADIVGLIENAPNQAVNIIQDHSLEVKHGQFRQVIL